MSETELRERAISKMVSDLKQLTPNSWEHVIRRALIEAEQHAVATNTPSPSAQSEPSRELIELVESLTQRDDLKKCPFCSKTKWGEELHDPNCPFAIAYRMKRGE